MKSEVKGSPILRLAMVVWFTGLAVWLSSAFWHPGGSSYLVVGRLAECELVLLGVVTSLLLLSRRNGMPWKLIAKWVTVVWIVSILIGGFWPAFL